VKNERKWCSGGGRKKGQIEKIAPFKISAS
jgi:hypothetical protein